MRSTTLHTICILALGFVASVAHAELDPNMEAGVDCSTSSCMFQGYAQPSDALRGLSKLPVAKMMKINDYVSNPSKVVSLTDYPQFAPVGELRALEQTQDGVKSISGSSVIVSPCFILTSYHVAFRDEERVEGKDYSMVFSAGQGTEQNTFAGHTRAIPFLWGDYDGSDNDWALMKLDKCVGGLKQFGWVESSKRNAEQLVSQRASVAAVGYSYKTNRAELSAGMGKIVEKSSTSKLIAYDASAARQQSGGALFTIEDGSMKIAALITEEAHGNRDGNSDTFQNWDREHTNKATSVSEILNRPEVKSILDADKARVGNQNPATERNTRPLPSAKTQMASI